MFIRFVVGADSEKANWLTGVITEARDLRDEGVLEKYQIELLEEIYAWLNENLPCPPFSKKKWSSDAVCWFKDNAGEPIQKVWEIVALLKEHGVPVRMLRSDCPGKILYEDDFQVVAEERNKM